MRRAFLRGAAAALLLWLGLSDPGLAAESKRHLSVVYTPPRLSVEARGVSAAEVLREIGAKVGFAVVEIGGTGPALTISIKDAPLEEALRQLLRGENHALAYRDSGTGMAGGGIATIVLLGPPTSARAIPGPGEPRPVQGRPEDTFRTPRELPRLLDFPAVGRDQDNAALQVEQLLRAHALPGLEPRTEATPSPTLKSRVRTAPEGSARGVLPTPVPSDTQGTLAATTRLAQQNLKALMDGLATATASLLGSGGHPGR